MLSETERNEVIAALYQQGMGYSAIARIYGMSRQRIQQIVLHLINYPNAIVKHVEQNHQRRLKDLLTKIAPLIERAVDQGEMERQGIRTAELEYLYLYAPKVYQQYQCLMEIHKYGMTVAQLEKLVAPFERSWKKFRVQFDAVRYHVINKGHEQWELTFAEWLTLWSQSGAWQAGNINQSPRYGMVRIDPTLPYQAGNVHVIPMSFVAQQWWANNR